MPLINLHTHSRFSDGTLSPEELALRAFKAGLKYFSLTDLIDIFAQTITPKRR
jgi:histidinol phosphatase-like PHP family hydrolase